mmetsp:Transcript_22930/g.71105  ORF Transcript_22930/g.71105 Transcript_22930/m.71105 type:complete len:210 (-) Transcript_22930:6-635(-)
MTTARVPPMATFRGTSKTRTAVPCAAGNRAAFHEPSCPQFSPLQTLCWLSADGRSRRFATSPSLSVVSRYGSTLECTPPFFSSTSTLPARNAAARTMLQRSGSLTECKPCWQPRIVEPGVCRGTVVQGQRSPYSHTESPKLPQPSNRNRTTFSPWVPRPILAAHRIRRRGAFDSSHPEAPIPGSKPPCFECVWTRLRKSHARARCSMCR